MTVFAPPPVPPSPALAQDSAPAWMFGVCDFEPLSLGIDQSRIEIKQLKHRNAEKIRPVHLPFGSQLSPQSKES